MRSPLWRILLASPRVALSPNTCRSVDPCYTRHARKLDTPGIRCGRALARTGVGRKSLAPRYLTPLERASRGFRVGRTMRAARVMRLHRGRGGHEKPRGEAQARGEPGVTRRIQSSKDRRIIIGESRRAYGLRTR